ncbi:MAG: 30S ribosomal protein S8 [Candidatus Caenarcaniphilales bacterium]|nr:30S ribosomal protein S8 [Candidatus Caenarcaniphilales bacterium]
MSANSDPIADMLTRLRNGIRARKKSVAIPHSVLKENLAATLQKLGLVSEYRIEELDEHKKQICIIPKYINREPVIRNLERGSKPGRRYYVTAKYRLSNRPQHAITILTTSKGIMSGAEAHAQNVGGELLCTVW